MVRQRIILERKISNWKQMLNGDPQWAELGPVLLLINTIWVYDIMMMIQF